MYLILETKPVVLEVLLLFKVHSLFTFQKLFIWMVCHVSANNIQIHPFFANSPIGCTFAHYAVLPCSRRLYAHDIFSKKKFFSSWFRHHLQSWMLEIQARHHAEVFARQCWVKKKCIPQGKSAFIFFINKEVLFNTRDSTFSLYKPHTCMYEFRCCNRNSKLVFLNKPMM